MVQTLECRPEDDVQVIRLDDLTEDIVNVLSRPLVPLDVGLNDLTEDIVGACYSLSLYESQFDSDVLSRPLVPCDTSIMPTLCDTNLNRVYVSLAPSYAPAEEYDDIVFYEDERGYKKVANAIADDCHIYFYRGMLYNIPADAGASPPFTCVTSGRYIGVFSGMDYVPMVEGITNAVYVEAESLETGERALRNAIDRSRFPTPLQ
ncbi:hypothetical protein F4604DRAFT_1686691 [Suillus subluteus]|nr:hypothetical protein F4604DRAFT_1686691 [Suillus subluteus]